MITKLGKTTSISTYLVKKHLTKNFTPEDYKEVDRKLHVGENFPTSWYTSYKMKGKADKFGKLVPQLLEDLNKQDLKDSALVRYGLIPAAEVAGAYYQGRKFFKKEAGLTSNIKGGLGALPGETLKGFVHPINLGLSAYNVASGNQSVGGAIGETVGGAIGEAGVSKVLDPLINLIPNPYIKGIARIGAFIGSMAAGSYLGGKGAKLMKVAPIYKRKGYQDIQNYNEGNNLT